MKYWNKSADMSPTKGESTLTSTNKVVYFKDFTDGTTPFDVHPEDDENEDVFSYSFVCILNKLIDLSIILNGNLS